jgi:hypothetical protein
MTTIQRQRLDQLKHLTSQMKHILGINIQRHNGVFKIIKVGIYRELLKFILYSVIKRETISFRRNIYNSIPLLTYKKKMTKYTT